MDAEDVMRCPATAANSNQEPEARRDTERRQPIQTERDECAHSPYRFSDVSYCGHRRALVQRKGYAQGLDFGVAASVSKERNPQRQSRQIKAIRQSGVITSPLRIARGTRTKFMARPQSNDVLCRPQCGHAGRYK